MDEQERLAKATERVNLMRKFHEASQDVSTPEKAMAFLKAKTEMDKAYEEKEKRQKQLRDQILGESASMSSQFDVTAQFYVMLHMTFENGKPSIMWYRFYPFDEVEVMVQPVYEKGEQCIELFFQKMINKKEKVLIAFFENKECKIGKTFFEFGESREMKPVGDKKNYFIMQGITFINFLLLQKIIEDRKGQ